MSAEVGPPAEARPVEVLGLVGVAAVAGALTGLVAASFGLLLEDAAGRRERLIERLHNLGPAGFVVLALVVVACTVLAVALVLHVEPHAEGSGIPRVEAVVEGRAEPERPRVLPIKYLGGLLAIGGGGLALGREGPSVQMGGVVGNVVARAVRLRPEQVRMVIAGGAAAGLATAFNAPIAGGVFVLEELLRRFDPRATLATLAASGAGFAATDVVAPHGSIFQVPALPAPTLGQAPLVALVALVCGVLGVTYTRAVLAGLALGDVSRTPALVRAAGIGLVVAAVAWARPTWVGGGETLAQQALLGTGALVTVAILLLVRFALGVLSYAANAPGGLFAPMLVLGSHTGLLVALVAGRFTDVSRATAAALALTGLAAFFTASVQAPVTGLVLATEMTGSTTWLAPMLGAVAIALMLARLAGERSIYDSLADRSARNARLNEVERGWSPRSG